MELRGLQKTTLLDFPGHVACTVFTGGCNFRCPFCHNAGLLSPGEAALSEEAFFDFLARRKTILDGVCITGGEPMLQADLPAFLDRIKKMGLSVKLDTNGSFPRRLQEVCRAGLVDYLAMDIKNAPSRYGETAGVSGELLPRICESVDFLMQGTVPFEFRTTLVKELHTEADIAAIGAWIANAPHWFLQMFSDSGDVLTEGCSAFSEAEAKRLLQTARQFVPTASLRGV